MEFREFRCWEYDLLVLLLIVKIFWFNRSPCRESTQGIQAAIYSGLTGHELLEIIWFGRPPFTNLLETDSIMIPKSKRFAFNR